MKQDSTTNAATQADSRQHIRMCLAVVAALAGLSTMSACEEKGPPSSRNQPHESEDFHREINEFAWPAEPSHVVALEFKDRGTIRIALYDQVAPKTVAHFVDCVTRGVYDDTLFHRVIKDFMIQGGDPATRKRSPDSTRGNWGDLSVEDEFRPIHQDRGVVSIGNRGRPNSGGSQFFILQRDSHHLDGKYTAFGRVISGIEIVDEIAEVETDAVGRWGKKDAPLENVVLMNAVLERGAITKITRQNASDANVETDAAPAE